MDIELSPILISQIISIENGIKDLGNSSIKIDKGEDK